MHEEITVMKTYGKTAAKRKNAMLRDARRGTPALLRHGASEPQADRLRRIRPHHHHALEEIAGERPIRGTQSLVERERLGMWISASQRSGKSSNNPGCQGFNAFCSWRKESAFFLPVVRPFRVWPSNVTGV
jgi:hypothetical protein